VVVHAATVLSTIVVFYKDILQLGKGILKFENNEELKYILRIIISALPIAFIGLFLKTM
jgi:undecaprenyl-diphosphatase